MSAVPAMRSVNRQWTVGRPSVDPGGLCLTRQHFVAAEAPVPDAGDGEIVVQAEYFSPDPMNHAWVRGLPGKFDPLPPGAVMRGGIAGRVVRSRHPDFVPGEAVTGFLDWADYSVTRGIDHMGVPIERVPAGVALGSGLSALGMTGLCAYIGMADIARPRPGETVLVSGASGGIGSLAGQIARLLGARAVGIAGGAEKCALVAELGFDAIVDYKQPELAERIAAACPGGANVFFDNVGGGILDAALLNMAECGRVVICGALAHYGKEPAPIFNHMQLAIRSLTMQGFFYFRETARWPGARARMAEWVAGGRLRDPLDVADGFEVVPEVALSQFAGGVRGRKLIRISR